MPLLQNEDTVITSGRDEQYSSRGHIPHSLTSFSLGWGIYFWHNNEGGRAGQGPSPVLTQESHITEAADYAAEAEGTHITGSQTSGPSHYSLLYEGVFSFSFFKFPEMAV